VGQPFLPPSSLTNLHCEASNALLSALCTVHLGTPGIFLEGACVPVLRSLSCRLLVYYAKMFRSPRSNWYLDLQLILDVLQSRGHPLMTQPPPGEFMCVVWFLLTEQVDERWSADGFSYLPGPRPAVAPAFLDARFHLQRMHVVVTWVVHCRCTASGTVFQQFRPAVGQ
jgi:hypothetical protein